MNRSCDGRLVIQERDQNNNPTANYVRGLDRSETLEGAGGIGGLLARQDGYGTVFYFSDANGNVRALVNQNQQVVARYLYDPYGNMIGQSGGLAEGNLYRFSTKEYHPIHGLYYFQGRYYDPNLQRWLTEDPIGESGGINLYAYVDNNPISLIDPWGLMAAPPEALEFISNFFAQHGEMPWLGWYDTHQDKVVLGWFDPDQAARYGLVNIYVLDYQRQQQGENYSALAQWAHLLDAYDDLLEGAEMATTFRDELGKEFAWGAVGWGAGKACDSSERAFPNGVLQRKQAKSLTRPKPFASDL